ncbi:VOC family protein [Burkholderia metallica]|uniref:VOC family protein n=1 Tax=Burkholderia metallica TaxID=488729 RepID=UPI00157BAFFD|nr:VOC family protein [Burkholderia metallica]NTZ88989.1 VOC family protein [Burkholderia metallica]
MKKLTVKPNSLHHLAITTGSTREQIKFFVEVLGCELEGLYWMHNQDDNKVFHSFLRLNDSCWISFVEYFGRTIEPIDGVTHALSSMHPSARGTMHHLALNVDTLDDLLAMRDRIRSRGVNVFGPLHHGFCSSIYFAGPEGLNLEISTSTDLLNPHKWIDTEVCELAGIDMKEIAAYISPDAYVGMGGMVPQPPIDQPGTPKLKLPAAQYRKIMEMTDEEVTRTMSEDAPPIHNLQRLSR